MERSLYRLPNLVWLFAGFAINAAWCSAQQTQVPQPTAPLPAPAIAGPLQMAPPYTFDAGPLGKLNVNGAISGTGAWQGNPAAGDEAAKGALSNGQVFLQKTDGWWQFYVQAGAYTLPALGTPFLSTADTIADFYGPVPVGFLKLVPSKNLNILIGQLPSVIGAEYTFTFENMNIERGLVWNQENSVNRGVQVNDSFGKLSASVSWNDGFYSNRYSWITGALTYAFNAANALLFDAGGNLGQTGYRTLATPVQNNSSIYNLIYTYTEGNWIVQPYFQYTDVPANPSAGVTHGAATRGGALLVNYNFKHHLSLASRGEYISSTGSASEQSVNLVFGPGSGGWSITVTPTFQDHRFFVRGDFSYVQAANYTPGSGFGPLGTNRDQARGMLEAGFLF